MPRLLVRAVVQSLTQNSCSNLLVHCTSCFQTIANSIGLWYSVVCRPGLLNVERTVSHLNNGEESFRTIFVQIVRWEERQFLAKTGLPINEFIRIKLVKCI